jgi:hypothetical protein
MALSGELSDLSLAELIEFFCNQRKTGRLKIAYERAPGFFYFQNGALADAKIGVLRGVDAVYYALTMENAQFKFSPSFPPEERTIHQPWAQVALEGLRRMDEGITPVEAFPSGAVTFGDDGEPIRPEEEESIPEYDDLHASESPEPIQAFPVDARPAAKPAEKAAPLSMMVESNRSGFRRNGIIAAVVAVLLVGAAVGVPAGWYGKRNTPTASAAKPEPASAPSGEVQMDLPAESSAAAKTDLPSSTVAEQPKSNHETRDRTKPEDHAKPDAAKPAATATTTAPAAPAATAKPGPKMVTVQVSYDENGRVTGASGGDATAARIARQRRFPAGKPGTATVSIPMN